MPNITFVVLQPPPNISFIVRISLKIKLLILEEYLYLHMSTGYQIDNQTALYFLTFTVVEWVDIFTRKLYVDILLESFTYCRENKGLQLYAYVVMSNHVHVIVKAENNNLSDVVRDFKRYTATKILKAVEENKYESRKVWMLKQFEFAANKHRRNSKFQFWQHDNHAIELESHKFVMQKLAYIHENPIRAGFVEHACDWMYSSQRNYDDLFAIIEIDKLDL